jgi:hypothetical protein
MLRLKKQANEAYLALPGAEPVTMHEIPGDSLPYACQCPLCGGIFQIPTGILYKIEDDGIADGTFDGDVQTTDNPDNPDLKSDDATLESNEEVPTTNSEEG